jgi:hypothetical protein
LPFFLVAKIYRVPRIADVAAVYRFRANLPCFGRGPAGFDRSIDGLQPHGSNSLDEPGLKG